MPSPSAVLPPFIGMVCVRHCHHLFLHRSTHHSAHVQGLLAVFEAVILSTLTKPAPIIAFWFGSSEAGPHCHLAQALEHRSTKASIPERGRTFDPEHHPSLPGSPWCSGHPTPYSFEARSLLGPGTHIFGSQHTPVPCSTEVTGC